MAPPYAGHPIIFVDPTTGLPLIGGAAGDLAGMPVVSVDGSGNPNLLGVASITQGGGTVGLDANGEVELNPNAGQIIDAMGPLFSTSSAFATLSGGGNTLIGLSPTLTDPTNLYAIASQVTLNLTANNGTALTAVYGAMLTGTGTANISANIYAGRFDITAQQTGGTITNLIGLTATANTASTSSNTIINFTAFASVTTHNGTNTLTSIEGNTGQIVISATGNAPGNCSVWTAKVTNNHVGVNVANAWGFHAYSPVLLGTATQSAGVIVDNQGSAQTTTAYGVRVQAQSGSATNWSGSFEGGQFQTFGGLILLNDTSNFNVNINTGTSTGTTTIGNSLANGIVMAMQNGITNGVLIQANTVTMYNLNTRTGATQIVTHTFSGATVGWTTSATDTYSLMALTAQTLALVGGTGITALNGVMLNIARPTITDATAMVIGTASTMYLAGPPIYGGAGPASATVSYTLHVATGNVGLGGLLSTYNNIATQGNGVLSIPRYTRPATQTNTTVTLATYTVPAADASFEISANINVTVSTTVTMTVTCTYTDEANVARTLTLPFFLLAGTLVQSITTAQGNIAYESMPITIRAKASTVISIQTAGTVTAVTYTGEGRIVQIA